jgi:transposase
MVNKSRCYKRSRITEAKFRQIVRTLKADLPHSGTVEIEKSYFGSHRVRGKRGRGASGKTIVFGASKAYTEIVPNCTQATLQAVIRSKVAVGTVIHSDGLPIGHKGGAMTG